KMRHGKDACFRFQRQEAHRYGIAAERRQFEATALRPIAQQLVGHLDHTAGTVADQRVGPYRSAMIQIHQDLQPLLDDVVRFSSADVGDKADAARVVLVAWIVKPSVALRRHPWMLFLPSVDGIFGTRMTEATHRHLAVCMTYLRNAN